jgi:hypothetical protein
MSRRRNRSLLLLLPLLVCFLAATACKREAEPEEEVSGDGVGVGAAVGTDDGALASTDMGSMSTEMEPMTTEMEPMSTEMESMSTEMEPMDTAYSSPPEVGDQANASVPSASPTAVPAQVSLAGAWQAPGIGFTYQIEQTGSTFSWKVTNQPELAETGSGRFTGAQTVEATWTNTRYSASAQGTVTIVENGAGRRIEWSNGIVFERL